MILAKIRTADKETLQEAIRELIRDQARLTLGELEAVSKTIMARGKQIGVSIETLNQWAQGKNLEPKQKTR